MNTRTRVRRIVRCSALTVVVLLVACGSPDSASRSSSPTPAPNPSAPVGATSVSSDGEAVDLCSEFEAAGLADEVVLRIYRRPLNQAPGFVETQGASHIVYADGRIMIYGPQAAVAPGFANPSLQTARLSSDGVAEVIDAARTTGLLDERARVIGQPSLIASRRYEVILVDDGSCHSVTVYVPEYSAAGSQPMDEAVQTATESISRLTWEKLYLHSQDEQGLDLAEPVQQYDVERIRVVAVPEEQARTEDWYDGEERAWPLGMSIASFAPFDHASGFARCAVIEVDDMQTLRPALDGASVLTPWVSDGVRYILYLRPLWPDESSASACDVPPDMVAAVCTDGASAPFPTTMPDPSAEAVSADIIVTGTIQSPYPARWTTPDGARPGACGADPGTATIVTPVFIQIDGDPLVGSLEVNPNGPFVYALLPGGVPPTDQYVTRADLPFEQEQRVLVSLTRREPLSLAGGVAEWDLRLLLTVAEDGTTHDYTNTLADEPLAALTARIQAAAAERVPDTRTCEHDFQSEEAPPHPDMEAHISDVIVTGTVVEVLPAQWTTADGLEPPGSCWSGVGEHLIITPVVIDLDDPVMTHLNESDTPSGRVVVAVFGGTVGSSDWSGWGSSPFVAGERVLVSLYRQLFLMSDVPSPAGMIFWEAKMKFTLTADGLAVGYPNTYAPEPVEEMVARIVASAESAPLPTPTP